MKNFKFIVNRNGGCGAHTGKEANTPPCCSKRASRFVWALVLMLTIGIGQMWGAIKNIAVGDFTAVNPAAEISQVIDGFTIYCENGLIDSESFRAYSGKVFSITSSIGDMSEIVFTFTGTANNRSWGQGKQTYTVKPNSDTWSITGPNQARITNIKITYTPAGPSYTITATRNNNAYGTVSVSGTTITATPADCYQVASGASGYTVTSGTATISHTSNSNTLTVTPSSDCTVQVNFEKKTVNTYVDEIQGNDDIEACETHDAPSLDDKTPASSGTCAQQHWHFMGWVTEANKATPTDLNIIAPGTEMTASGATYYAVWAKGTEGANFNNTAGGTFKIYANVNSTKYYATGTGGKITASTDVSDAAEYVFEKQSAGVYYIKTGDEYIKYNSSTNLGTQNTGYRWTVTTGIKGSWRLTSETSDRGFIYRSGTGFGGYSTGNVSTGGSEYYDVEIGGGYEYSDYKTVCCTELGQINGSVSVSQVAEGANAGKLQATWTMDGTTGLADNGLTIKIYKDGATPTLVHTSTALSKNDISYVATGYTPDYCSEYYATLTTERASATYCEGAEQGKSENNCVVGAQYSYTITKNNYVELKSGETEAENTCDGDFMAEYVATNDYTLPTGITVSGVSSYTWDNGVLSFDKANVTGDVSVTITGVAPSYPTITIPAAELELDFETVKKNDVLSDKTFTITGEQLIENLSVAWKVDEYDHSAFSFEVTDGSLIQTSGAASATVTVSASTATPGEYLGTIVVSSAGATSKEIVVGMTVQQTYTVNWYVNGQLEHSQTDVTNTDYDEVPSDFSAFTDCEDLTFVGWKEGAIDGGSTTSAPSLANIGTKITANKDYYAVFAEGTPGGTNKLFEETFANSSGTAGWSNTAANGTIAYDNEGWSADKAYGNGGSAKFGTGSAKGYAITPAINVDGSATLTFKSGAWSGDKTTDGLVLSVEEGGTATLTPSTLSLTSASWNANEVAITNADGPIKIKFSAAQTSSNRFFLDDVLVTQEVAANWTKWYTTCPHYYAISLTNEGVVDGKGSFVADKASALAGESVTLTATDTENAGQFNSWSITGLDSYSATTNPLTISMPDNDITVSATFDALYAITKDQQNGTITLDKTHAIAGETVTISNVAADAQYKNPAITVFKTGDESATISVTAGVFTMPAYPVTVRVVCEPAIEPLAAPVLGEATDATYQGVTLNWTGVAGNEGYVLTVQQGGVDVEGLVNVAIAQNATSYTIASGLAANTDYTYSIYTKGNGTTTMEVNTPANGNFSTEDYPAATLTLHDANGSSDFTGSHKLFDVVELPSTAAACSKTFMGWSASAECTVAPEIAKGANYTLNALSQDLYAVYADVTGGGTSTQNIAYTGNSTDNMVEGNNAETLGLDPDEWSVVPDKGGNDNYPGLNSAHDIRLYYHANGGNTLTITAPQTIVSVGLTFTGPDYSNAWVKVGGEAVELSDGVYPINATSFVIGNANTSKTQVRISNIAVNFNVPGTPSNYSTACAAAPEATADADDVAALVDVDAAGVANGTIAMTYENVDESAITVGVFTHASCQPEDAAPAEYWLTASPNGDKNIAYTIAENTSYNDARSAYIKLTAPAETSGPADAVVIIPVTQAKKPAVFASLAELAAADVASGTEVTVTFSELISGIYSNKSGYKKGIYLTTQAANDKAIEVYYNQGEEYVPNDWVIGGRVAATSKTFTWTYYVDGEQWELVPLGTEWTWDNGDIVYTEPASVSAVEVSGTPTKTTYNTGEAFDPAGLTVTVTYSDESVETITSSDDNWAYVTWAKDPATFAAEHIGTGKSVSIKATYNAVESSATEISGLTVNKVAVTGVTLNQNAATLKVGKTVTLTATIAPANATYKTVTWESDDEEVATVENGVVTAVAAGSATITATATDDNTKTATCTITVTEGINFAAGDWTLVKDVAELTAGSYVIIAAAEYDKALKSYVSGNNCGAEDAIKDGDLLEYDEDFGIFEIKAGNKANTIALFDDANENYLYAASGSYNHMKAETTLTDNSSWSVSVTSVGVASLTAQGTNSHNQMKYNHSNNPPIFSCYSSGQDAVALYKYYAPVPKVTYNQNTEDEVENLPAIQKTEWEEDAYKATVAAGPSRTGYTFTGWNSDAEGEGDAYAAGTKYSFAADIILYAQWEEKQHYTVTYTANGGTGTAPDVEEYMEGETVTVKANSYFTKPGFVYAGWEVVYNDGENDHIITPDEESKFTMVAYNVTIKALWEEPSNQKWVRVETTEDLKTDGTKYIIVGTSSDVAMTSLITGNNKNYYNYTTVVKTGNYLNGPESMTQITLEEGSESGKFAIKNGSKYIYSTTAKNMGERDDSFEWTIGIANGVATIDAGTAGRLQFNTGSPRFTTYTSSQQAVAIYREKALTPIDHDGMTEDDVNTYDDVEIGQDKTWTVSGEIEVGDVYMKEGAVIANSAKVKANDLYFKTKAGKSNQIYDASNLAVVGDLYYDVQLCDGDLDANYWYSIAVPFDVNLNNGVFLADGTPMVNRVDFEVWGYDTQLRAQTQSNGWKRVSDNMMHAGKAYLIGFNPGQPNIIRLKAAAGWKNNLFNGTSMSVVSTSTGTVHDNWNGLANPTMRYIDVDKDAQVFNNNTHGWDTYALDAARYNFVVGTAFFVQSASAVTISNDDHGQYRAPKRENENKCAYAVRITREEATNFDNQIIVRASEEATGTYTQGHDMLTMNGTSSNTAALLWTENYGGKRLAIEEAAWLNGTATYELKMYAPKAGTYSISVVETKDNADLYLTQDGAIIWNLSMGAYELSLNKGLTNNYGLLLIKKAPGIATGVEEVQSDKVQCTKVVIDDHVYILRGGQMYDVTGKMVK